MGGGGWRGGGWRVSVSLAAEILAPWPACYPCVYQTDGNLFSVNDAGGIGSDVLGCRVPPVGLDVLTKKNSRKRPCDATG